MPDRIEPMTYWHKLQTLTPAWCAYLTPCWTCEKPVFWGVVNQISTVLHRFHEVKLHEIPENNNAYCASYSSAALFGEQTEIDKNEEVTYRPSAQQGRCEAQVLATIMFTIRLLFMGLALVNTLQCFSQILHFEFLKLTNFMDYMK